MQDPRGSGAGTSAMARAPGFPTRRAPGHGTEQPRGSRQCCCLLLKSHGKIGGPVADSVGQAEPGVPVTSYSEEPGAAAGRSHARPPRSHNLTLRATTRPLPPPPRRSHIVQAGKRGLGSLWTGSNRQGRRPPPCEESQATFLPQTRQSDVTGIGQSGRSQRDPEPIP